jgi:hypothetical protein
MEPTLETGEDYREYSPDGRDEGVANADDLEATLRRLGFDLNRAAYVTYQVSTETREQAKALGTDARRDAWHGSVFVDHARWVVRLVRYAPPTSHFISGTRRYVDTLARRHGSEARGFSIEDPRRDEYWVELAARVTGPSDDLERKPARITAQIRAHGRYIATTVARGA